jgi:hypothetical protein
VVRVGSNSNLNRVAAGEKGRRGRVFVGRGSSQRSRAWREEGGGGGRGGVCVMRRHSTARLAQHGGGTPLDVTGLQLSVPLGPT